MAEFVQWEERFSVGIKEINDQHKKLIDLTNQLFAACKQGKEIAGESFRQALIESVDYVKTHFAFEEKLMTHYQYPEYDTHKKEHEAFILKILQEAKNFDEGKPFVPNHFVRFLRDWLLEHIAIQDKKLGQFLLSKAKEKASSL